MKEHGEGGLRPVLVFAIFLILSILLLIAPRFWVNSKNFGGHLIREIQRITGTSFVYVKDGFESLGRLRSLQNQYDQLLDKMNDYQELKNEVIELRRENNVLAKQLDLGKKIQYQHILAQVIAGDPTNLFPSITINKGSHDGLESGMVVTAFQKDLSALLGKIVNVGLRSAQVRLLIDPNNYVAARLEKTRLQGIVEGRGVMGELLMRYVRKNSETTIAIDEFVVTSGMQSIYPPNIYIGKVKEVRSRDYLPTLDILLDPIIDVDRIEYVYILTGLP